MNQKVGSDILFSEISRITNIDHAIYEAEKEVREGTQPISASEAKKMLDHEYYNLTTH